MFACFKADGNSDFFTNLLKRVCKKSAKISAFSLRIFVWEHQYLDMPLMYPKLEFSLILEAPDFSVHTSPIASILGWSLYFKINFIIGSATFSKLQLLST